MQRNDKARDARFDLGLFGGGQEVIGWELSGVEGWHVGEERAVEDGRPDRDRLGEGIRHG